MDDAPSKRDIVALRAALNDDVAEVRADLLKNKTEINDVNAKLDKQNEKLDRILSALGHST